MIDIAEKVLEAKEKQIKTYPRDVNWASDAGHPCERYLFLSRVAWDKRKPHDVTLQCIFERGRAAEDVIDKELKTANFKVVEHERPYELKEFELRGRIDRKIEVDGKRIPVEYKTISHNEVNSIALVDDMIHSKRSYIRLWPAQLLLYMDMSDSDEGLFYFKDSLTWYPKTISAELNPYRDYLSKIYEKLLRVNEAVRTNTLPDRFPEEMMFCSNCAFLELCGPERHFGLEAEIYERPDLEELLEERDKLREMADRYNRVDAEVKGHFKGVEKAIVGRFLVEGKEVIRYMKPQPAREDRFWKLNITRLGE